MTTTNMVHAFVGDIDGISARQLEYISSVLKERGFKNETVIVQAVGKPGDNYVANVKRVIVEENGEVFKMIAKIAPTEEIQRAMMNTALPFQNEYFMYTEVLPKFLELQQSADVFEDDKLKFAVCYGCLLEPPNEVILLEDLQMTEFIMLDRFKSLADESVRIVLKDLATLHSLSYALKNKEPETYTYFKDKLINLWEYLDQGEETKVFFEQLETDILAVVEEKYKKWFKGAIKQMMIHFRKNAKIDKDSKYSIIQQGDAWNNNIMFRMKDDKPVECCMIDYQVSKESNPVADIQYMIFNCTDYNTRAKHYHEWIDYYHSELDKCLANYGLKANYVYPRDRLDSDLRRYSKMTFGITCFGCSLLIRESDDAAKLIEAMDKEGIEGIMKHSSVLNLDEKTIVRFKERLEGLLNTFLDLGYL